VFGTINLANPIFHDETAAGTRPPPLGLSGPSIAAPIFQLERARRRRG